MTRVESDIVFAKTGACERVLDIYRAPDGGAPVTVYLHGGGWRAPSAR